MRFSFFIQSHVGEDLDARNDRLFDFNGQDKRSIENAVHAESDPHFVRHRLDMHIRCIAFCRIVEDRRDDLCHRRIFGDLGLVLRVCLRTFDFFEVRSEFGFEIGQGFFHFAGKPAVGLDHFFKIFFRNDEYFVRQVQFADNKTDRVARFDIFRIKDADAEHAVIKGDRHELIMRRRILGNEF